MIHRTISKPYAEGAITKSTIRLAIMGKPSRIMLATLNALIAIGKQKGRLTVNPFAINIICVFIEPESRKSFPRSRTLKGSAQNQDAISRFTRKTIVRHTFSGLNATEQRKSFPREKSLRKPAGFVVNQPQSKVFATATIFAGAGTAIRSEVERAMAQAKGGFASFQTAENPPPIALFIANCITSKLGEPLENQYRINSLEGKDAH